MSNIRQVRYLRKLFVQVELGMKWHNNYREYMHIRSISQKGASYVHYSEHLVDQYHSIPSSTRPEAGI